MRACSSRQTRVVAMTLYSCAEVGFWWCAELSGGVRWWWWALRRGGARERRKGEYPLAFCATIVAKRSPPSLSLSRPPAPVAPDTQFVLRLRIKGGIWAVAAIIGSNHPNLPSYPR